MLCSETQIRGANISTHIPAKIFYLRTRPERKTLNLALCPFIIETVANVLWLVPVHYLLNSLLVHFSKGRQPYHISIFYVTVTIEQSKLQFTLIIVV